VWGAFVVGFFDWLGGCFCANLFQGFFGGAWRLGLGEGKGWGGGAWCWEVLWWRFVRRLGWRGGGCGCWVIFPRRKHKGRAVRPARGIVVVPVKGRRVGEKHERLSVSARPVKTAWDWGRTERKTKEWLDRLFATSFQRKVGKERRRNKSHGTGRRTRRRSI